MIEEELISIWQSSNDMERAKFEKARLIIDLKSSLNRIEKLINFRDSSEIIAAFIVIPIFTYFAFTIPFILTKIGSIWIVIWVIYVVVKLLKSRKNKPSAFTENYFDYLQKTRNYLLIQKKISDSMFYWYILPFLIGMLLFVIGIKGVPMHRLILTFLGMIGLGFFIHFLNKRGVKKEIIPRLNKIDELLKIMKE
ncbi:MAG: hypothetical protein ABJK28_11335 [Algibacter sp.]